MPLVTPEHEELLAARVAVLATNGDDGRPQLSAVWFLAEDDCVKISVTAARQKTRNLLKDPRCTFFAFHPSSPNYYLEIRGDAEIQPDPDRHFADRISAMYDYNLRDLDAADDTRVELTIRATKVNVIDVRD